ncbi:MAG TPA: hypothetical protein VMS76_00790 [Planctomycetota bacterium]|nr:hypothetical protein [Planctomycetota bacterium]
MIAPLGFLLLALQAAAPAQAPREALETGEAHAGSVPDTLRVIRDRSEDEQHERALELAAVLAASAEWQAAPERERAEGSYLLGVARERAADRAGAVAAFRSGAALAGPGELRLDSLYNAGSVLLADAEELRLRVDEVRSKLGLPPLDPQPGAAGLAPLPATKGKEGPDDVELARGRYREARAELALRLRAGPGDIDTRANLELIQRRLRELDEIEREREQQEQEQQQQKPEDQQKEKGDQEQDPEQQDPSQDPQQEQGEDREDTQAEEPEPGEDEETKTEDSQKPAAKEAAEERLLSREEVQRLLDQLQAIDEKARAVRAALQSRRRMPVEKDW